MPVAANNVHRWSRGDYERLAAEGFFTPDARLDLIDGVVYDVPPQSSPHATCLHLALRILTLLFSDAYVRVQSPLALGDDSQPDPDLAVVPGALEDYDQNHPTTALLVVEVADSSLAHDKDLKIPLYARCGIPEAWLVNVPAKTLEIFRDSERGRYRSHQILRIGDTVSPLSRPEARIAIADLFPR